MLIYYGDTAVGCVDTDFTKLIYKTMNTDEDNCVDFEEFVIYTWDFLSQELPYFVFSLIDKDKTQLLPMSHILEMAQRIHGVKHGGNYTLEQTIYRMKADYHGRVSMEEFRDHCGRHQSILGPASALQNKMRRAIIGELYWKDVEFKRFRNMPGKSVWDILKRTEQEVSDAEITLNFDENM